MYAKPTEGKKEMKRRMLFLLVITSLLLFGLTARLAVIQLMEGSKYRLLAENQSLTALSDLSVRGTIYDRGNRPLTNMKESFFLLIEDRKVDEDAEKLLHTMDARFIESSNDKYHVYNIADIDRTGIKALCRDYGALVMKSRNRYSENQPAMHIIGYVSQLDQLGVSGIEKDFDTVLASGQKLYSVQNDGRGYIIPGAGIHMKDDGREWGVLTTLDLNIQNRVEMVLSDSGKSGAVVVTHIPSGEILASACTPGFDPHEGEKELVNKATSSTYPSGPFFPLITATAAPETDREGLSEIVSLESFVDTAQAYGLSEEAVELLSGQAKGNLSEFVEALKTGDATFDEGQSLLTITPMQAARITRIIALDGWDSKLTVIRGTVEGIRGASFFPKIEGRQAISAESIKKIQEQAEGFRGPHWYSTFIPEEDPLYGITLYIEDDYPGESIASSMFREIISALRP